MAAVPAANTQITNQATASYLDGGGTSQIATSNPVTTTVQQVGAFTLSPSGNTKSAAAGATVYMPYVLTNTGNGTDGFTVSVNEAIGGADFSRIEIYADANEDGLPDASTPALCSSQSASTPCALNSAQTLAAGAKFPFVVAYTIPPTAVGWGGASNTATVTAAPSSTATTFYSTYTPSSRQATDTVNLVTDAAFSVTKSITAPSVAATTNGPNPGAWPTPSSGARGTVTTYTFNYANNGGAAGNVYLKDTLPAGLTYQTGTAVWSSAGGTALTEGVGNDTGLEFEFSNGVVEAVIPNVAPGVSGTLSFKVLVAPGAAIGTSTTTNVGNYSAAGCSAGATINLCTNTTVVNTNSAAFTVLASYGVTMDIIDAVAGTAGTLNGDTKTAAQIVPGGFVTFTHRVENTGNASDTFNLSIKGSPNSFPSGTTYTWYANDGVTPLLDSTGDSIPDTGPIAAGAFLDVKLRVRVPSSTPVGPANYTATALATSFGDATKLDAGGNVVTNVIGSLVDLTNSQAGTGTGTVADGDLGPGPSPQPSNTPIPTTTAGTPVAIALYVKNNDTANNTYTLSASQTASFPGNLPAGWTATFSSTSNCATPSPITSVAVPALPAVNQALVYACVTPPAAAPAQVGQPVYFQVLSTGPASTGGTVSDVIHDAVTVNAVSSYSFSLFANGSGQIAPGGALTFAHTVKNTGTNSCGNPNFSITANPADTSWTTAIYEDTDGSGTITLGDQLVTNGTLSSILVGQEKKILVRVFAPGTATAGTNVVVPVIVTDTNPTTGANCGTQNITDTATVVTGSITVQKTQAISVSNGAACTASPVALGTQSPNTLQALPGTCLVYVATATNAGTAPVSNVTINDAAPAHTSLAGGQPSVQCESTNLSGSVTYSSSGNLVACGSAANVLAPGGTVTLRFAVQIDN